MPAALGTQTRYASGVPVFCCVILGKQITLSEAAFLSGKSRVWTPLYKVPSGQAANQISRGGGRGLRQDFPHSGGPHLSLGWGKLGSEVPSSLSAPDPPLRSAQLPL